MRLTAQNKARILRAVKANLKLKQSSDCNYTHNRHSMWLQLHPSIYSRMMKGDVQKLISDEEWIRIALKLHVNLHGEDWLTAETMTYKFITNQVLACMKFAIGGMFCDDSSIGKTYAAERMSIEYPNVALVDCSNHKTWPMLLRAIAREFGFDDKGKISEVKQRLISNLYSLEHAVLILDEFGDLGDGAILELKGLWNATEGMLGWYAMGANGFRAKLRRKIGWQKVGYEEWFNRLGNRVHTLTGSGDLQSMKLPETQIELMKRKQIEDILRAQLPDLKEEELAEMVGNCDGNARRIRTEIIKRELSRKQ